MPCAFCGRPYRYVALNFMSKIPELLNLVAVNGIVEFLIIYDSNL